GVWWYYFIVAFVFKATLPVLILMLLSAVQMIRGRTDASGETILLAGIGFYFFVISIGADDIGLRYVLPVFPLIYVWISRIVPAYSRSSFGPAVLILLLAWHAWAAFS